MPVVLAKVPSPHSRHTVASESSTYQPRAQSWQIDTGLSEKWPGVHEEHSEAAPVEEKPLMQLPHTVLDVAPTAVEK
jgi:hypothetical protein